MTGSGPHGRIIARDIAAAKSGKTMPAAAAAAPSPAALAVQMPADEKIRALFEAPTVARLAALIGGQDVNPEPAAAAEPAPGPVVAKSITTSSSTLRIADVLPLTPLQQGLLFHASAELGGDDVYAVQLYVSLNGPLDAERLCAAVQAVAARHPNLAARFSQRFDEPVQEPAEALWVARGRQACSRNPEHELVRSRSCFVTQ